MRRQRAHLGRRAQEGPDLEAEGAGEARLDPRRHVRAGAAVRREDVATSVVCGPDPERHVEKIQKFIDAGYDHVYIHQIGADQDGFMRFYEHEVLPQLR